MSEIKVSKLTNRAGTGAPDFSQGVKIEGTASTLLAPTRTESATEPANPANGDTWYDTDNNTYDVYINDEWKRFIGASEAAVWYGDRGIVAGGYESTGASDRIQYFSIATTGNTTDFGDLTTAKSESFAAMSDATYGVMAGGAGGANGAIDYITVSTAGNATSFGTCSSTSGLTVGVSDGTYGVMTIYNTATTEYVTIASSGNATSFGSLSVNHNSAGGASDATYGLFAGGNSSGYINTIEYITIATTGDASDFGDLTVARRTCAGVSDATRSVFGGGRTSSSLRVNVIDYVTTATTGNATDFGDLVTAKLNFGGTGSADGTYGVFSGGNASSGLSESMEYITIQTTGNATDFGDLAAASNLPTGFSGSSS